MVLDPKTDHVILKKNIYVNVLKESFSERKRKCKNLRKTGHCHPLSKILQ